MARLNFKKAFSLIELLVVISIIATLTAIMLPNFMGARQRATDSQKKQNLVSIKNALRLYYNDNQSYPITMSQSSLGSTLATYIPSVSAVGFTYSYYQTGNGDGFQLCSGMDSGSEDVTTSQSNCAVGSTICNGITLSAGSSLYVVCAN